ncbi:DUF3558 domain-containing protein [Streptomyces sp. NBC_00690]|uniref:DUF3558 domain-containing protein n=1 Tax=Streptomyces sp. NBC_00690 TaxID=2975808 RepID=UPI002E2996AC|nr:DUF3558 domain-containing protein [Streptomyces sp. NBC_00690]
MQRKAYAPRPEARAYVSRRRTQASRSGRAAALQAAFLAVLAVGCTSDNGASGSTTDAKAGTGTKAVAQPGKYRTLFEPCGSVGGSALKDLLPGAAELPDERQREVLRGTAGSTFDTDRRVSCAWKSDDSDASHSLSLDFERVVSYDPAVSDEDRAHELFAKKQLAAAVPGAPPAPSASSPSSGSSPSSVPSATTAASTPGTSPSSSDPTSQATVLGSRVLDGLGDAAYLDDDLASPGAGSTAQRRTVSVVFRTSNVIATVVYTEQSGQLTVTPDSASLQEKAQRLAKNLVKKFND